MIETRISGIPCQVEMTGGEYHKPDRQADSDVDFRGGWADFEFEVYDRRGRPANWLKAKLNDADLERITQELIAAAER